MLRLRQLEKSLLSALNEAKGRILDDDSIITHLETLKHEAEEIAKRVEETDATMAEVETTSQQYIPLAQSCSSIYFTLESLNQVGHYISREFYNHVLFMCVECMESLSETVMMKYDFICVFLTKQTQICSQVRRPF